jgi:hypothetical protein
VGRKIMIPISKCNHSIVWGRNQPIEQPCQEDYCHTVINIIHMFLRVLWIINNQRTTQPVTILILEVTVIPKRSLREYESRLDTTESNYRLGQCIELVQEALIRYERTLGNKGRTIDIVCVMLKNTVPMLQKKCFNPSCRTTAKGDLTIEVPKSRSVLVS